MSEPLFLSHKDVFTRAINDRLNKISKPPEKACLTNPETATLDTVIVTRIRPLLSHEIEAGHVQAVGHDALSGDAGRVCILETKKLLNGKLDLSASAFSFDKVYTPDTSTQDIYKEQICQMVDWVLGGGTSLALAYGQTGSGKTYTISELEAAVTKVLLEAKSHEYKISLRMIELFGDNAYDLLNNRGPVKILEDVVGTVQMLGAVEQSTEFVDEMLCQIETARRLRMTSSTAKNDQSTRSHAVCQFLVTNKSLNRVGSFLLVDLAGSEANADILQHSKERMAETREINKSLAVLKDCIRARAQWSIARGNVSQKHIHIPFRNSSLTKLLKNAFDVNCSETGKTLFIACISPSIIDIPQSKNTLRYGELLRIPVPKAKSRAYDPKVPTTWNNVNVREWIRKNSGKPQINPQWLAPSENGADLCRLQQDEFIARAMRTAGVKQDQAKLLYFKLWALHIDARAESNRNSTKAVVSQETRSEKGVDGSKFQHGSFFRISAADDLPGSFVMVLGPSEPADRLRKTYVCADLEPIPELGFELLVARQKVMGKEKLLEKVDLKYIPENRCYRLPDD